MSCMLGAHFVHTTIHDVESFLWVLGHSIIKFLGLGGPPREITPVLREALLVFMGNYDSQEQKKQILDDDKCFIEFLEQVSPEFEVLKGLMCAWHHVLHLAYRYWSGMEFKYPHQTFIRCIECALDIQHRASREWRSGWNRTRTGYLPSTDHLLSSRDTSTFLESHLTNLMKSK